MKPRKLLLALFVPSLLWSQDSPPAPAAVFIESVSPATKEIQMVGEAAIDRLAVTLVSEIRYALAKTTAEEAVDVCHLKKLPQTGDRITGLPRIRNFKLTSLRVRAPANEPDAADRLALDHIDAALNRGDSPPKVLLQRIDQPGGSVEWRVYRPLGLLPQCATCHGDPADQSAALREKLAVRYPGDRATGYSAGEWRGLLRVTVDPAPPPASAKQTPRPTK